MLGNGRVDVPDTNEPHILSILIFVLDRVEHGIGMLAGQAVPCIGVPSLDAGRCNREDEVFVCL